MTALTTALFTVLLCAQARAGSDFARDLMLMEEMNISANLTTEDQLPALATWINQRFGYEMSCDRGLLSGLTGIKCLIGLRKFARAVALETEPKPAIPLRVKIASSWAPMPGDGSAIEISVPFNADQNDLRTFLHSQLATPAFRSEIRVRGQIADAESAFENRFGVKIKYDGRLSSIDALNGLLRASAIDPSVLKGQVEAIEIGQSSLPLHERKFLLTATLAFGAGPHAMEQALRQAQAGKWVLTDEQWPMTAQEFIALRTNVNELRKKLQQKGLAKSIICSDRSGLTLRQCYGGLRKLELLSTRPGFSPQNADLMVVGDRTEFKKDVGTDYNEQERKTAVLIRQDVRMPELYEYAQSNGWYKQGGEN